MIRDQCRAYCKCKACTNGDCNAECENDYLKNKQVSDVATKSLQKYNELASTSVDAAYLASLRESLKHTAKAASERNASKFNPDEQLLSSTRDDLEIRGMTSDMVPLRRRDRLEELLILEEKKRLREKAKLRAIRRAAGVPGDDGDDDDELDKLFNSVYGSNKSNITGVQDSNNADGIAQSQILHNSANEGAIPANETNINNLLTQCNTDKNVNMSSAKEHTCSAEDDLNATLERIKNVMQMNNDNMTVKAKNTNNAMSQNGLLQSDVQEPLSGQQIYELRKIIHDHSVKAQDTVRAENAETNEPRLCNHCFEVNVQAKQLCPDVVNGSVAFDVTGKVINPAEGVKYGTSTQRGLDGSYRHDTEHAFMNSTKNINHKNNNSIRNALLSQRNDKLTQSEILQGASVKQSKQKPAESKFTLHNTATGVNNANKHNKNVSFDNKAYTSSTSSDPKLGIEYPGSTYNTYAKDAANNVNNSHSNADIDYSMSSNTSKNASNVNNATSKQSSMTTATSFQNDNNNNNNQNKFGSKGNAADGNSHTTFDGPSIDRPLNECKTSTSLWRTTNQEREDHMRRFAEIQKLMQINAKKVYDASQHNTQQKEQE